MSVSYLIHPSPLLDALVALFEATWERMRRLGAQTRFQVAMEATRRGWL